jgi:hypothetical protein
MGIMEISIEAVEKLVKHADVSYAEAKAALEEANGDILDALIALERQGKTSAKSASYRTDGVQSDEMKSGGQDSAGVGSGSGGAGYTGNAGGHAGGKSGDFNRSANKFMAFLGRLAEKSVVNHFEVYRHGLKIVDVPVLVLVILLICVFPFMVAALIAGLFLNCSYRFKGPDLEREPINRAMGDAADYAENLKQQMKSENGE